MITGKVWGTTTPLFVSPIYEHHRLFIKPHMQCSFHRHPTKWNGFRVISGKLEIIVQKADYKLDDVTRLDESNCFTAVRPGEFHLFRSLDEPVICDETYFLVPWIGEDIERRSVGGQAEA